MKYLHKGGGGSHSTQAARRHGLLLECQRKKKWGKRKRDEPRQRQRQRQRHSQRKSCVCVCVCGGGLKVALWYRYDDLFESWKIVDRDMVVVVLRY